MQLKYRLFQRQGGTFYWQENGTNKQGSLRSKNKREAEKLLHAMNESFRQPTLNLAMGRAYLSAHDPKMISRTWQAVMDEMAKHGKETTQTRSRRAFASISFDPVRNKPLIETTSENLLDVLHASGNATAHYIRRLHNLALNLGWLAWPILHKAVWPKIHTSRRRAVTPEEHAAIMASEKNVEKAAYYSLLYETGAAQTDAANLTDENIDWQSNVLIYQRQKLGPDSEPSRLTIGGKLCEILLALPQKGFLFPTIQKTGANARATEFRRRCRIAGVSGVSLHSYRNSWAQRAKSCGYPQRFAQEALGHSSRAVHEAYARGALVVCPALDEYEKVAGDKLIMLPTLTPERPTVLHYRA